MKEIFLKSSSLHSVHGANRRPPETCSGFVSQPLGSYSAGKSQPGFSSSSMVLGLLHSLRFCHWVEAKLKNLIITKHRVGLLSEAKGF